MSVLTAKGISSVAIELLIRRLSLPRTVTMVPGSEFVGPNGGTITIRVPQPGASSTQASPGAALVPADVDETPVDVSLSHLYHLKNISDQELSYDLENFARQITRVQANAVAAGAEDMLASVMNALAEDATIRFALTPDPADTEAQLLEARQRLSENDCPADDRWMACAPDIISRILAVDKFVRVDQSGSSDALRNGIVGRLYGFTFVESNALDPGEAVAYHRSGFAFATRPPALPKGATSSSVASAQGIGLRQVFQYDAGTAQDQSLVSTFAGAAAVYEDSTLTDEQRFVKIGTSAT